MFSAMQTYASSTRFDMYPGSIRATSISSSSSSVASSDSSLLQAPRPPCANASNSLHRVRSTPDLRLDVPTPPNELEAAAALAVTAAAEADANRTRFNTLQTSIDEEQESCLPPYSQIDPLVAQSNSASPCYTFSSQSVPVPQPQSPSFLAKTFLGSSKAQRRAERKHEKRLERIEEVHDAWLHAGIDTRRALALGQPLPPYFFNPPKASAQEINAAIDRLLP